MIYVAATLYFWQISKNWFPFVCVGFVWQIISCVMLFWMPESPSYLISAGRLEEAHQAFATIARLNRKQLVWDEAKFSKPSADNTQGGKADDEKVIETADGGF